MSDHRVARGSGYITLENGVAEQVLYEMVFRLGADSSIEAGSGVVWGNRQFIERASRSDEPVFMPFEGASLNVAIGPPKGGKAAVVVLSKPLFH